MYLTLPNYSLAAFFSRNNSKRGGTCILVKKGLQWRELHDVKKYSISGLCEFCAIELVNYKTAIVCVYRVPKVDNLNIFFSKLEDILQFLMTISLEHVILAGDYNIDIMKKNTVTLDFECLLLSYNLSLALKEPTRLSSGTCIDNFAHNNKKQCKAEVLELALSDHTAQLLKFPVRQMCAINFWRKNVRDFSLENITKFKDCLSSMSFSEMYAQQDPNRAYTLFLNDFKLFYNLCFPYKIVTILINKKPKWVSRGLKMCSKKKRQLLWNFRLKPSGKNQLIYRNYSKLFKKIIRLTQRAQNNYQIKMSNNQSKTTWQIINSSRMNVPRNSISQIKVGDRTITNPKDIANAFNNYFVDKIKPILNAGNNVTSQINNMTQSIFMAPSIPIDIYDIIKGLKNSSSVGYDDISTRIVKSVAHIICGHLSFLINLCIISGVFPDGLKISILKPLFKKEDKEQMEFYRPIALIPIFSKIFEKFIYGKLYDYFEHNNILCREQKGFRRNKNINMAIYDFYNIVLTNVDKRTPICAVYCDMTQAFDYVDHNILLRKLESYGIRGNVLQLIKSYLSDRKQITNISRLNMKTKWEKSYVSETRSALYGVPQGSVLGPLLFIVYINDLPKVTNYPISLFADDSTVSVPCTTRELYESDINNSLGSIVLWLDNNNLKINLTKTQIMHFSQRLHNQNINVSYKGNQIHEVDATKFLGITIDKQLNWKAHIADLSKKLSSSAYVLLKLAPVVNRDALLTAYHGLAASVLRYGVIFWGNSTDAKIAFKAQKRCIRAMFGLKKTDSCKPFFDNYKILTLPSLYIFEVALFVRYNPQLFLRISDVVKRNRRDNERLLLHSAKTTLMRKSLLCMAPIIYNKLPNCIKHSETFKKKLKLMLTNKCYYNINDFLNDKKF